jgi:hypothetical protein
MKNTRSGRLTTRNVLGCSLLFGTNQVNYSTKRVERKGTVSVDMSSRFDEG